MGQVIPINRQRVFQLEEARALLPLVRRVTQSAVNTLNTMRAQLSLVSSAEKRKEMEETMQGVVETWQSKIRKLGCHAKGMWLVDFDKGDGYYCWLYPEQDILFTHNYEEGFGGRTRLS